MTVIGTNMSANVEMPSSLPVFIMNPIHQRLRHGCLQLGRSGRPFSTSAECFMMSSANVEIRADRAARPTPRLCRVAAGS